MQDKYAGDLGDFGKLGLLRWLVGIHPATANDGKILLSLGILWYLASPHVDRGSSKGDGKHVRYLSYEMPNRFSECDEVLFSALKSIGLNEEERRSFSKMGSGIGALEAADIWYRNKTKFFAKSCDDYGQPLSQEARKEWFLEGCKAVTNCDLVFVDPDNGLMEDQLSEASVSAKHVLLSEIKELWNAGHSLVIYHTPNRKIKGVTHNQQIREWSCRLQKMLPNCSLWGGRYGRGSSRAFFVLAHKKHHDVLKVRLEEFRKSQWVTNNHWDRDSFPHSV